MRKEDSGEKAEILFIKAVIAPEIIASRASQVIYRKRDTIRRKKDLYISAGRILKLIDEKNGLC